MSMEGEREPTEIKQLRRDLETLAGDMEAGRQWLSAAMEKGWAIAGLLAAFPEFADLLGGATGSSRTTGRRRTPSR